MKKTILAFMTVMTLNANARISSSKYCSQNDFQTMSEIWTEFAANGIDSRRLQLGMGIVGGDCLDAYSLERSAERPHREDAPRPACGIIFILNEENQKEQAAWILDTLGKRYITSSGKSLSICSKVSSVGSSPGVTVHN